MLAALWGAGGLLTLLGAASPFAPDAPAEGFAVLGSAAVVVGCVIWLARRHVSEVALHVLVTLAVVLISASLSQSQTTTGLTIGSFAYFWVAIYVAMVFPRRVAVAYVALTIVASGLGVALSGLPHAPMVWLLVSGTVIIATAALSSLSTQLRRQAATDPLTGILNRTGLARAARREIALAARTGL